MGCSDPFSPDGWTGVTVVVEPTGRSIAPGFTRRGPREEDGRVDRRTGTCGVDGGQVVVARGRYGVGAHTSGSSVPWTVVRGRPVEFLTRRPFPYPRPLTQFF